MLKISLLGNFSASQEGNLLKDLDTPRLQSLLAYLVLYKDAPQSRAHLAFTFWPDSSETQARTNLRNLLHQLRHSLPEADTYLEASGLTLQWRPVPPIYLDVDDFEQALAQAEQAQARQDQLALQAALERATRIYQGDLLPSCYEDWIIPRREVLRQRYLAALEKLVWIKEERSDYPAAIHYAQCLLRHDPLHEATYRNLIRLHSLKGDRASALRVYHTCTTVLQRELEVEPSPATREVYEQLLGAQPRRSPTPGTATAFSPLVGRGIEWSQLLRAWRSSISGAGPRLVLLRGEAGIGKTRLLEEMLGWAARQGITSLSTRCYAAEGALAYAPVTAWLRTQPLPPLEDIWLAEVARLLPEVLEQRADLPRPQPLSEAWQRVRLFEALSRAIFSKAQPLLLAIDDLQWCDRDTLEWLHFLLRFDRGARLLVLGAYRPEEVIVSHPLILIHQTLSREGLLDEIELQSLDEECTHALASQIAGQEISLQTAHRLYQETEGNPLFIVESVRAGIPMPGAGLGSQATGEASLDRLGLPAKVLSMLEARLSQVSALTRELAGLAATIGREFSFGLLAQASGLEEVVLVGELDELWQHRIIREHGAESYDFSHDKLREVAYASMSAARRRLLHRQVAEALERLYRSDLNPASHQIAFHYEQAGMADLAIPFYLRAAEMSRQIFANEEAISLLRRGIALRETIRPGQEFRQEDPELGMHLWELLGDILEMRTDHEEALQAYQNAQGQVFEMDRIGQARLQRKTAAALREERLYSQALEACQAAESILRKPPAASSDAWWDEWLEVQVERVWAHYWLAQWVEMDGVVRQLAPVVKELGRGLNRMHYLMASCLLNLRKDRYVVSEEMLENSIEALALSQQWGSLRAQIDCQFELGFLHLWRRELDQAEEHLQVSLQLAESTGVFPMRTLCLTYLTILSRFRGQMDAVQIYAQRAQEFAESAHMPDYVAAAKGNLAWLSCRKGDLLTAKQLGQEALALWSQSPLVYPFQWQALWPLVGVALGEEREREAWAYLRALLDPTQQLLPKPLNSALAAAIQTERQDQLESALFFAQEMGYL